MAETPTVDEVLTPDDAVEVLEELLDAQSQSYVLGLKLKLPLPVVDAIFSTYAEPRDRLLQVIIAFTRQVENPTWRAIADALRSPALNLISLANRVEAAHIPDPTATRDREPETALTGPATQSETIVDVCSHVISSQTSSTLTTVPPGLVASVQSPTITIPSQLPPRYGLPTTDTPPPSPKPGPVTSRDIKAKIEEFEKRFNDLKKATRECLEKKIAVKRVAETLTSLPADDVDEHKQFLGLVKVIHQALDHSELFGTMNFYWDYLSYQLLDHLIKEFNLAEVKGEMEAYKGDLLQFREETPLTLFCQTQKKRRINPPQEFQRVVAEFDWPDEVTLETVEQFRQEYACFYHLRECAMMVARIRPECFIVTWFIPGSIVDKLRSKVPRAILKKYFVTELEIAGKCVYRSHKPQVSTKTPTSGGSVSTGATAAAATPSHQSSVGGAVNHVIPFSDQELPFVEQPSNDFFCPVTYGLLLHPHLTECCGKHLSREVVNRIRREGRACPLCNKQPFHTMLNQHFRRQVRELRVFCCHEDSECAWQGGLFDMEKHVRSCGMSDTPLKLDLLKLFHDLRSEESFESPRPGSSESASPHSMHFSKQEREKFLPTARPGPTASASPHSILSSKQGKLTVQCHYKRAALCEMARGSATSDHECAYFMPWDLPSVYRYNLSTEGWDELLPPCPYRYSALVIIEGALTAVGGFDKSYTNKLVTFEQTKWIEKFPPMKAAHSDSAVVRTSDDERVVVIGGNGSDSRWMTKVELLDVKSKIWYELTDLPRPLTLPSATICGNQIHVMGDAGSGYSFSLQDLPSSEQIATSQSNYHTVSWSPLPPPPVTHSTAATLCGELVLIGGRQNWSSDNSIRQLVDGQWVEIGSMFIGKYWCLVVSLSPDNIMIVGGWRDGGVKSDSVEECTAAYEC